MNPGELTRKYEALEKRCADLEAELVGYKEFFDASLAMNISAAALPQAARVQRAIRELEAFRIRAGIRDETPAALAALKNISKEKA